MGIIDLGTELDRLREKLLDLSNRNALLNYRITRRSIPIVDELSNEIFDRLVNQDKEFRFAPLAPPKEEFDPKRPLLSNSIKTLQESAIARPRTPHRDNPRDRRYFDDILQTELSEAKLESQLKSMARDAKSAIEETGVNYLHLALGFLEWRESEQSEKFQLAPLILLPVQLSRDFDKRSGKYIYKLGCGEEETKHNLSLERRLDRDFGLRLPEFELDTDPESYFTQVEHAIQSKSSWKIQRQAIVGFFSFHKLLMYLDADPANWIDRTTGEAPELATTIICGQEMSSGAPLYANEYRVDEDNFADSIPLAIDADSSQHSALCDILRGKNIVIEGPPGTGKSQTITNAIAAAMYQGKSVLFVAEKLAALQVVQSKLEAMQLADFCLPIHSENASSHAIAESLKKRLSKSFRAPKEIDSEKSQLKEKRNQLTDYANATAENVGPQKETLFDLIWKTIALRQSNVPWISDSKVSVSVSSNQFRNNLDELDAFSKSLTEIGSPKSNPWWGFWPDGLRPEQHEPISSAILALEELGEKFVDVLSKLAERFGGTIKNWFYTCISIDPELVATVEKLQPKSITSGQWRNLSSEKNRISAQTFVKDFKKFKELEPAARELIFESAQTDLGTLDAISRCIKTELLAVFGNSTVAELRATRVWISEIEHAVYQTIGSAAVLSDLGLGPVRTLAEFDRNERLFNLTFHPVIRDAETLTSDLYSSAAAHGFKSAKAVAHELDAEQARLTEKFHTEAVPDGNEIIDIERRLRPYANSWFPFLSGEFRRAKVELLRFAKHGIGRRVRDWLPALESLRTIRKRLNDYSNEKKCKQWFGENFDGLKTDWQNLQTLLQWVATAKKDGLSFEQSKNLVRRSHEYRPHRNELHESAKKLRSFLGRDDWLSRLGFLADRTQSVEFQELSKRAKHLAAAVDHLLCRLQVLKIAESEALDSLVLKVETAADFVRSKASVQASEIWTESLGDWYRGEDTDADTLSDSIGLLNQICNLASDQSIQGQMLNGDPLANAKFVRESAGEMSSIIADWATHRNELAKFSPLDRQWLDLPASLDDDPGNLRRLKALRERQDDLPQWCSFSRALKFCQAKELSEFTHVALNGKITNNKVADCYRRTIYEKALARVINESPILRNFSRQRHETIRNSFQEIDRQLNVLNRALIAHSLAKREPPDGISKGRVGEFSDMGLILHEIKKQKRHCRIRDLLRRAGAAVQALKPCFMMSPLSVAQYLDFKGLRFDLVIMDEASQIKPEDALGTILRAKQLVVVGDPKQLPPTSFFDRTDAEVNEEDAVLLDNTESILEVATKSFHTVRRLRWHYRSKHESLIHFSNSNFYDQDLIVFPSPTTDGGQLGVRLHYVDNGYFASGCNLTEAQHVAAAVIEHAKRYPKQSLGVGTFNLLQATVISDFVDKLCELDSEARDAIEALNNQHERLFIKNLENLQGDERDVIFISFTYGRELSSGKVMNRFGPMNQEFGWRRFNVLVTRARMRLEVFSSMRPTDILGGPDKSRGLNAMRDFLEFAETGKIPERIINSDKGPDSDFEVSVGKVIGRMGLNFVPQVGVAGFFIDIGILKPESKSDFFLGIECDGATYHSSKSARDRDRLRQEIIEGRGWKIHRIWSTDWFMNQKHEEERLEAAIKFQLQQ